ncbi:hypothetical protein ASF10_19995 [Flavobacterium sp. Leaf82]|uniref:hypothetical protein n=1 Tax=Flavobacterium sp. Leaf82 TaxID=1736238 RepID=UPI0006F2D892|nr:hypothetical protein [Flavobacterium sp. Leaf82]KQO32742.1 hypothetical protein ASF10_19995 [Flavobacterium sp. Leaf82]
MKTYYYLLFRIYKFYEKNENANFTLSASFVSTVLLAVNLITIFLFLNFYDIVTFIPDIKYLITSLICLWAFNYFFIVKKERFLEQNFEKDKTGGMCVVLYIILTFTFAFLMAKFNRGV